MPNGLFGRQRNPLDLFGGGTMPYLGAPGGFPGRAAGVAAPAPRKNRLQVLQGYPARPEREEPVPISRKRRLGAALAAFAARFGGGPGAGTRVGEQITGAPRRAQEEQYQRGLKEWEAGREGAERAYTLGRESEFDTMRRQQHELAMKVPTPATPGQAHEYRLKEIEAVPRAPTTRVMGTETKEYDQATGEWNRVGPAPVYPGREPQRHGSMLEQWLSTAIAQLERLKNDPLGADPEIVAQAERRIIEQYNKMVPSYPGAVPITELPGGGGAGQRPANENDPLGIL